MKSQINIDHISTPEELLLVLKENHSEARARCLKFLSPILFIFVASSLINIFVFIKNPNNFIPLFAIFAGGLVSGLFALIIFRVWGEKKPTMKDAEKLHHQKVKAAISRALGNKPVEDNSFSGKDYQPIGIMDEMAFYNKSESEESLTAADLGRNEMNEEFRIATHLEGEIHAIKYIHAPAATVMVGSPQRIVVKGKTEREVDRINAKVEDGVLIISRDPLIIGNSTFYGHVEALIGTNHGSISINKPSTFSAKNKSIMIDGVDIASTDVTIEIYLEKPIQE